MSEKLPDRVWVFFAPKEKSGTGVARSEPDVFGKPLTDNYLYLSAAALEDLAKRWEAEASGPGGADGHTAAKRGQKRRCADELKKLVRGGK